MKRLLDSSNKARPAGDPVIYHRDMEHHCKVMCKSMLMGDYTEIQIADFSAKSVQVTIWCWWPLGQGTIEELVEEKQRLDAEDAVNEIDAN